MNDFVTVNFGVHTAVIQKTCSWSCSSIIKYWQFYFICCSWTTKIVLPLKESIKSQTITLAARFNDIHPSLLLFLNRLRKITIDNRVENLVQHIHRKDYGQNVVEITHDDKMDRWLVVKKSLDASKISLQVRWWPKSSLMYFIYFTFYYFFLHFVEYDLCKSFIVATAPCPTNSIPALCWKMKWFFFNISYFCHYIIFFYLFKLKLIKSKWQAKSGVEVESTEIALAFPLRPPGQKKDSKVLLSGLQGYTLLILFCSIPCNNVTTNLQSTSDSVLYVVNCLFCSLFHPNNLCLLSFLWGVMDSDSLFKVRPCTN